MALVGIQALSYRNSSCSIFMFLKDKSPELQYHLKQDKQQLRPSHIISSITQTQIKHMLPTSFKFRVNPYIKTILSKTRENSRLKTRYLKGITTEQLFIISILRYYSEFSLFYSTLKNKFKQTRHIFYFVFNFTIFLTI